MKQPTTTNNTQLQSTLVQDALGDVVSDFERTLEYSNHLSSHNINNNTPGNHSSFILLCKYFIVNFYFKDILHRVPSKSSVSSSSVSSCMDVLGSTNIPTRYTDFDAISVESNSGLSPKALKSIREQMALGLERMKELEEKVKIIPSLQVSYNS